MPPRTRSPPSSIDDRSKFTNLSSTKRRRISPTVKIPKQPPVIIKLRIKQEPSASDNKQEPTIFNIKQEEHAIPHIGKERQPQTSHFSPLPTKKEPSLLPDLEDFLTPAPPTPILARKVNDILQNHYPISVTPSNAPILDSLIATILSQATSRSNSTRAFEILTSTFPTWSSALKEGALPIQQAIHCAGLSKQKSIVIYTILTRLTSQTGKCDMEYIRDLSTEDAKKELCSFKGVGPKTAACVLMFAMRRNEFPVDTHVRRIAARLGWMPPGSSPEQTYEVLNKCLPNDIKYSLHVLLIEHGRNTCKARVPQCAPCPLYAFCPAVDVNKPKACSSQLANSPQKT